MTWSAIIFDCDGVLVPGIEAVLAAGMTVFAVQPHGIDPRIVNRARIVSQLSELSDLFRDAGVAV